MFPYMIGSAEVGNYAPAFELVKEGLAQRDPYDIAEKAGAAYDERARAFKFNSLSERLLVKADGFDVVFDDGADTLPVFDWRLMLLHYLLMSDGTPPSGELAHFRKMPGGTAYEVAFKKRSVDILIGTMSQKPPEKVREACAALGGEAYPSSADASFQFWLMPHFPVIVQIWAGDEEMSGNANVLFDSRASRHLPTEDMAVGASLIARFMMKQYKLMFA